MASFVMVSKNFQSPINKNKKIHICAFSFWYLPYFWLLQLLWKSRVHHAKIIKLLLPLARLEPISLLPKTSISIGHDIQSKAWHTTTCRPCHGDFLAFLQVSKITKLTNIKQREFCWFLGIQTKISKSISRWGNLFLC